MKKKIMMLSCIAACAIVSGYVGMKAYESHAYESNSLLMQNVEALTQSNDSGEFEEKKYEDVYQTRHLIGENYFWRAKNESQWEYCKEVITSIITICVNEGGVLPCPIDKVKTQRQITVIHTVEVEYEG